MSPLRLIAPLTMKVWLAPFVGIGLFSASAVPALAAERTFMVSSFENLIVEGNVQVRVITGSAPSAKATGDKRMIDTVRVERSGNSVTVRYRPTLESRNTSGKPLTVVLTTHSLQTIIIRGSADVKADKIKANIARLEIQGAGSLTVDDIKSDRLISIITGSAKFAVAKGAVRSGEVLIDGAADVVAPEVIFNDLRLIQNGQAKSQLRAERKVEISTAGSGSIEILGKATCFVREGGNANIKCKGHGI
ncbi:MAG: DUF2807 domain-containing protein [Sphingomonadales bacterium]|jgi:hypothetical protein|uniref:GIN domain-containing protein n=2 Tax=Sphingorhabdus sp. TaxID=1902408 RepID=UPI003BB005F6|nr:DUF2807 domain-containing protein [Sphingomonadales bacterium]MBK9432063.1 DUF2807 domain-containing protein [Sphingomonadales bacterium]MBL0023410.1 DUF2807 domain-containing protein [Sphingomonadales bacterium]